MKIRGRIHASRTLFLTLSVFETPLHDLAGLRRETDARINDYRNVWRTLTPFT